MKEGKTWSLSSVIPLMILITGSSLILAHSFIYYQLESEHVRQESIKRLHALGNRLDALSSYLSDPDSIAVLNEEIAMMSKMAKLSHIAFTDGSGSVLAATDPGWSGQPSDRVSIADSLSSVGDGYSLPSGEVIKYRNSEILEGTFAFEIPNGVTDQAGLLGLISVGMDLTAPLDSMRNRVIRASAVSGAWVLLVAGLFWLVTNHFLSKPLRRLVSTTRRFASGDYSTASNLMQKNELGEISGALDTLRAAVQDRELAQRNSQRLAAVVENSENEIYVADANDFRLLSANAAARKNLGYLESEVERLMPWDFVVGMTPENIHEMTTPLLNGDQEKLVFETEHRREDGSIYPVKTNLMYMSDQSPPFFTAIVQDISEKKQQRTAIALRNRAIDAMDVGVSITDIRKEGYPLVYVNQALCELTGYEAEELIGQPVKILQKDNQRQPVHKKIDEAQAKGEPVQVVLESTRRDGTRYTDELSLSPVFDDNNVLTHYIGVNRDITEKLDTQKRLLQAQKMDAIGQLSSGIAHDFNNILSVVGGNIELLSLVIKDHKLKDCLNDAEYAVKMGARLTHKLLSFAKKREMEFVVLQINDLVLSVLDLLRSIIGERITISVDLATDLWPVKADPSEIENTVINLAINARDAMPKGGSITITTNNVVFEDEAREFEIAAGNYVKISVADNGIGMSDEVKAKIFEPFFTTKETGKGTGLGLASIYGFAKQSGGQVNVYSEVGKGTVVSVYIPCFSEALIESEKTNPATTELKSKRGRVLVVEDSEIVRKATLKRLHALGYNTEQAENGAQALSLLKKDSDFDLVFSDVVMDGGVSGYDLAHWVQSNLPCCPVLLTSGFNQENERTSNDNGESIKLLRKPYSMRDLQHAIDEIMTISETKLVD